MKQHYKFERTNSSLGRCYFFYQWKFSSLFSSRVCWPKIHPEKVAPKNTFRHFAESIFYVACVCAKQHSYVFFFPCINIMMRKEMKMAKQAQNVPDTKIQNNSRSQTKYYSSIICRKFWAEYLVGISTWATAQSLICSPYLIEFVAKFAPVYRTICHCVGVYMVIDFSLHHLRFTQTSPTVSCLPDFFFCCRFFLSTLAL